MDFMEAVCKLRGKGLSHTEVNEIIKAFQTDRTIEERSIYNSLTEEVVTLKEELEAFKKGITRINGKCNKLSSRIDDIDVMATNTRRELHKHQHRITNTPFGIMLETDFDLSKL